MSCPVRGVEPRSHLGGGSAVELHRYGPCPQKIAIFVRQLQKFAIMKVPFLSPLQASASNRIPNPEQARILREIQSSRDTLHQGFLQQLIVGGCALLGIVASLGIPDRTMNIARILALSASISIALGIVAIATALFCQVLRLNRLLMRSRREVCKRTQDTEPKELMTPFEAGAEIAGFGFLFVGLGLIVASRFFL